MPLLNPSFSGNHTLFLLPLPFHNNNDVTIREEQHYSLDFCFPCVLYLCLMMLLCFPSLAEPSHGTTTASNKISQDSHSVPSNFIQTSITLIFWSFDAYHCSNYVKKKGLGSPIYLIRVSFTNDHTQMTLIAPSRHILSFGIYRRILSDFVHLLNISSKYLVPLKLIQISSKNKKSSSNEPSNGIFFPI